jgi:hypothetical protein
VIAWSFGRPSSEGKIWRSCSTIIQKTPRQRDGDEVLHDLQRLHELRAAEYLMPGYGLSSGGAGRRRIGWGFGVDGGCREGESGDCKHGEIAGI